MNVTENYHAIHWTQMRSESLLDFYNEAPLEMQCQSGSGIYRPNNFNEKKSTENVLVLCIRMSQGSEVRWYP